jgi:hypothetical protein
MLSAPWVVLPVAPEETDDERVIEAWWTRAAEAAPAEPCEPIEWRDLPAHRVSPYVTEAWRAAPLDALARRYRSRDAVLLFGRRAHTVEVYGVVCLSSTAATVGGALVARRWLLDAERRPDLARPAPPPLAVLSLETACALGEPHELVSTQTLDPAADGVGFRAAIDTLVELAYARTPRETVVSRWGYAPREQFHAAKMRYYLKLCLIQAPAATDAHREALALGIRAFSAWTEGLLAVLVSTSEHRVDEFIRRFRLPIRSRRLAAAAPLYTTENLGVSSLPLPLANDADLPAAYARSARLGGGGAEARELGRATSAACVFLAAGGRAIGDVSLVLSTTPVLYSPALPTAFFVHLSGGEVPTRDVLLSSLLEFLRVLGVSRSRLTVTYAPPLFAVRELVWANGGEALHAFVSEWSAHAGVSVDLEVYTRRGAMVVPHGPAVWVPHPHVASICRFPPGEYVHATATTAAAARVVPSIAFTTADEPSRVYYSAAAAAGVEYTYNEIARWAGECVRADIEACRDVKVGTFTKYANDNLSITPTLVQKIAREWSALVCARLQAVATQFRAASKTPRAMAFSSAAHSPDYKRIEEAVKDRPDALEAFFRHLMQGLKVTKNTQGCLRAEGHITFNIAGQRALNWHEWRPPEAKGKGLVTLAQHHLSVGDEVALQAVVDWYAAYVAGKTTTIDERPRTPRRNSSSAPSVLAMADALQAKRDEVNACIRDMSLCTADTYACKYLRIGRGLADDAPLALIEENKSLRAGRSLVYKFGDGRPSVKAPALVCLGAKGYCAQVIWVDTVSYNRMATFDKRTRGAVSIGPGVKDSICLWRGGGGGDVPTRVVILAEGPETAFSMACAFHARPGVAVYASLGVGNFAEFHCDAHAAAAAVLVVCRENESDAKKAANVAGVVDEATKVLVRRFARVVHVWPPSAEYGDFNDVHRRHPGAPGSAIIRAHVEQVVPELRDDMMEVA